IAAVRALAGWLAAQRAAGGSVKIQAWQAPFSDTPTSASTRRVRLPAAALVESSDHSCGWMQCVFVLPDLGTAPRCRFQSTLRRLFESMADAELESPGYPKRFLIVTTNTDAGGARQAAWTRLLERLRTNTALSSLWVEILDW